jgi:hypothetical protein
MIEGGCRARLAPETLDRMRVGYISRRGISRLFPAEPRVLGLVDYPHSAGTEPIEIR